MCFYVDLVRLGALKCLLGLKQIKIDQTLMISMGGKNSNKYSA